jgi:hypothetical protein
MSSHFTHAEATAAMLQRAVDDGLPVMIPGARDMRVRPVSRLASVIAEPVTLAAPPPVHDLEREGGGARGGPRVRHPGTVLSRLWQALRA